MRDRPSHSNLSSRPLDAGNHGALRMTAGDLIRYIGIWSLAGALAFSVLVLVAFRSGLVFAARKPDGTLKDRVPPSGIAAIAAFLLLLIAFFLLANRLGLAAHIVGARFGQLFLLNLTLFLVLFAFDTLVIDAVLLGVWRHSLLRLPQEMGSSSMAEPIGPLVRAPLSSRRGSVNLKQRGPLDVHQSAALHQELQSGG